MSQHEQYTVPPGFSVSGGSGGTTKMQPVLIDPSAPPSIGDTVVWNGTLWVPQGPGVRVKTLPITSPQLLTLDTVRLVVVAGIASTVLVPIASLLVLKHGTTPYAAANPVLLAVASRGPSSNERWLRSDVTDTLTGSGYNPGVPILPDAGALPDMTNATGGALVVYTDNPVTDGNGTATLTVWYSALTGLLA
jgi:hypothetical protein